MLEKALRFCAVKAIIEHTESPSFPKVGGNVNVIALFNHEEIGSVSSTGAESSIIPSLIQRLSPSAEKHSQSISRSFLISADMGHAVHPNYASKHEENHRPQMNGGIILKVNAKQRYTTDATGSFLVKQLVERKGGKVQTFEVRNDIACGSTVGRKCPSMVSSPVTSHIARQPCFQKLESELWMSAAPCCPCIPSVKLLVATMFRMPST